MADDALDAPQQGRDGIGSSSMYPVGRARVLADLTEVVGSLAGRGIQAFLITGEAGIGKTRLLHDLLDRASALGCHALYATAQDYDHGIAYATLKDLVASLERNASHDQGIGSQLAALLDAADQAVLRDPLGADPVRSQSPYILTTRLLRTLSEARPLVIAIDDAHLADDESLTALSLAARHLAGHPMVLLFAARGDKWGPGTGFAATVGRLVDGGLGFTVELGPLDLGAVETFLETMLDGRPDDRLVSYIYARSRGNPLFARETLLSLQAGGGVRGERGTYYLTGDPSPGVVTRRGALLHRVFQQDQRSRELARVLSAFGRVHLDQLALLSDVTALSTEHVQLAFDSLSESGILVPGRAGWYEFAHPLIAEVLYEDLGPVERRRLHRAISEHARVHGSASRMGLLEWAGHLSEGAGQGDRQAIDAALQAAAATRHAAPLSAARWYQRALDLLSPDSPEAPLLLARQTVAYWKGSRPEFAVEAGRRALSVIPPGRLHATTLATVVNATYAMGRLSEALDLLDGVLPVIEEPAPFLAQRALLLAHLGRTGEAAAQMAAARAAALSSAPEDQAIAYSYLGHAENLVGHFDAVDDAAARLQDVGTAGTGCLPPGARLSALESGAYILSGAGSLRRARTLLELAAELAPQTGSQDIGGQIAYATAMTQFLGGEWSQALETIRSAAVRLEFSGLAKNLAWLRLIEVQILAERGLYGDARDLLDAFEPPSEWVSYASVRECIRARIDLACTDYDRATSAARAQRDTAREPRWRDESYHALDILADGYLEMGDMVAAREAALALADLADASGMPKIRHAADLALARIERRPQLALGVLEVAEAEGLRFVAARAHYVLGLLEPHPEVHLTRALALFHDMEAAVWQKRVLSRARECGLTLRRAQRPPCGADSMTDTERQLVQLVHDGLNNREISQVLHYSRKTVEAYLSRLYRKTGCRSRVELVVALERGALSPLDRATQGSASAERHREVSPEE